MQKLAASGGKDALMASGEGTLARQKLIYLLKQGPLTGAAKTNNASRHVEVYSRRLHWLTEISDALVYCISQNRLQESCDCCWRVQFARSVIAHNVATVFTEIQKF